jgi:hypothetical protein
MEKIEKQLEELEKDEDKDRPLTVREFENLQKDAAKRTALELADSIEDDAERAEVVNLLESRIVPSGKAEDDLVLARQMVNAQKNALITEELVRKNAPASHAATPGAPGKVQDAFTPTAEEAIFMERYGLTKEDVLKARQAEMAK